MTGYADRGFSQSASANVWILLQLNNNVHYPKFQTKLKSPKCKWLQHVQSLSVIIILDISHAVLTPSRPVASLCTTRYNLQAFHVLPTHCIYVCMDLRKTAIISLCDNGTRGFYIRGRVCSLRVSNWVFKNRVGLNSWRVQSKLPYGK